MTDAIVDISVITAICVGITQVFKLAFKIPDNFQPLTALTLGIIISLVFVGLTRDAALVGIIGGLSAMGLWSGVKNTVS